MVDFGQAWPSSGPIRQVRPKLGRSWAETDPPRAKFMQLGTEWLRARRYGGMPPGVRERHKDFKHNGCVRGFPAPLLGSQHMDVGPERDFPETTAIARAAPGGVREHDRRGTIAEGSHHCWQIIKASPFVCRSGWSCLSTYKDAGGNPQLRGCAEGVGRGDCMHLYSNRNAFGLEPIHRRNIHTHNAPYARARAPWGQVCHAPQRHNKHVSSDRTRGRI